MLGALKTLRRQLEFRAELERSAPTGLWFRWTRSRTVLVFAFLVGALLFAFPFYWLRKPIMSSPPQKSIAVLPFQNLSADPENAYLADGVQEEILTRLSKIADLKVISRSSTQRYKNVSRDLREIAKELGVAHVLEGSVQKSADQVRVSVQLINPQTDSHLWAEKFDRKVADIFVVESEIASNIANALQARLTGVEQHAVSVHPTENVEAHELYLRGRFALHRRGEMDVKTALDYFERAIAKDPDYARAYSAVADCYVAMPFSRKVASIGWRKYFAQAKLAATKALELNDNLAEAHTSLGSVLCSEFKFAEAEREFLRAIQLDPNSSETHDAYGLRALVPLGRFDEAITELKRAVELDPLSSLISSHLAYAHVFARSYPEAVAQASTAIALDPNDPSAFFAYDVIGIALALSRDVDQAIENWNRSYKLSKDYHSLTLLAYGYALKGDRKRALQLFNQLRDMEREGSAGWYFGYAHIAVGLGEKDEALNWLDKSFQRGEIEANVRIRVDPMLDPLRGDPRFEKLANQVVPRDPALRR
jgi:TolB-like protein/Tfp pilus assembly protein PilF